MNTKKVYTIKDIAAEAEVAPSTVSRVLGGKSTRVKVTEKTREKIFAAARKLSYCPNVNAQRLVGSKANTIALVVPSSMDGAVDVFADYFLRMLLQGLEGMLIARKYRLMIVFKHETYVADKEYLRLFSEGSIGGMLIWGAHVSDEYIRELYDFPVVQVSSYYELSDRVRYIGHDVEQGAFLVTENVLSSGCRRIACVWGAEYSSIAEEYRHGVLRALKAHGLFPCAEVRGSGFGAMAGERAMESLLQSGRETPEAVLFCTTTEAIGGYRVARRHGMSVPGDIILGGGYGVAADCPWFPTYVPDSINLGKLAAQRMFAIIDGDDTVAQREHIPVVLVPMAATKTSES